MEAFIGEIKMVGFNFAPSGWALCNGQSLPVAQYAALYSLLGNTYGGNNSTTFNLPDLRGRVPVNQGSGAGLSPYTMGQNGGAESVTLTGGQVPPHNHLIGVNNQSGNISDPTNTILAEFSSKSLPGYAVPGYTTNAATGALAANAVSISGGGQSHPNIQPFLTVNFIIALTGVFPQH